MNKMNLRRIPHTMVARTRAGAAATSVLYGVYCDSIVAYIRAHDYSAPADIARTYDALIRAADDYNAAVRDADAKEDARAEKGAGQGPHVCMAARRNVAGRR